nr:hypothetical protein [uncultured Porphyromonas sp.]
MSILLRGTLVLDKPKAITQIDPSDRLFLEELKFFPEFSIKGVRIKMEVPFGRFKSKKYPV